jgi:hypothetical protein
MAGRASVVLRDQFEREKRNAEPGGTTTSMHQVRENIALAIGIVREKLLPIDKAADLEPWLVGTVPSWEAERCLLHDEVNELERLRDHVDLFMSATVR